MHNILKSLELNGFKSFAEKTVFEFRGGITAIVGPNGSGKSNVIDGIRWLLGEREAKNLRGGKAEDLIFAGTSKRPRLGLAQASLHFENRNKFFPVDFEEVTISRQVSRDGVSKYFLNKSEVRLKDLVDFFVKAKLGTKGLVVITQGNSDVFVGADPKTRREMIEEMLGLREFELKKSEAERRLLDTEVNLERVRGLIDEILPHLRSLKRQAGRWERRDELLKELRELENEFFGRKWQEIALRTREIEKETESKSEELNVLLREKEAAEKNLKEVEMSQLEERKEIVEIRERTKAVLEKRNLLQRELGRLEVRVELQEKEIEAEGISRGKLLELVKEIRRKLEESLGMDFIKAKEVIKDVIDKINSIFKETKGNYPQASSDEISAQFSKIKKELEELEDELLVLKRKESELQSKQEEFYAAFKAAVSRIEAAKEKIEKWEKDNREKMFEKERLKLRFDELKRQIMQAGRNPEEFLSVRVGESGESLEVLDKKIFRLRGMLASIGDVDEALVKEAKATEERYNFLKNQFEDLEKARADLKKLISGLKEKITSEFSESLAKINKEFDKFFDIMFGGGQAKLKLVSGKKNTAEKIEGSEGVEEEKEEEREKEGGVEIDIKIKRKKINSLEMLSGGERSLVGIAALFALISVSPPPFLVLDEVDAALDERNARRFAEMLKEFSKQTQFIVVTHNRATMEAADVLYGVTLSDDGASKVVSLKLE